MEIFINFCDACSSRRILSLPANLMKKVSFRLLPSQAVFTTEIDRVKFNVQPLKIEPPVSANGVTVKLKEAHDSFDGVGIKAFSIFGCKSDR